MSIKHLKPLAMALALAALLLSPQAAMADALSFPRVFMRGASVYLVEPQRIVFLSMDTRGSHTVYTAADSIFTLNGAVHSGDVIWAYNAMGAVIAVDMLSGNLEEFGRGLAGGGGQIDVDRRFVWVASGDTLHRMDLTTREWVALPVPSRGKTLSVRGLISFNDQVHVIASEAVYILNTASEDWVVLPHRNFVLGEGDCHKLNEAAYFTRGKLIYRYDPSKRLWTTIAIGGNIRTVSLTQERLMAATGSRVYHINTRDFTPMIQPALPMLRNIRSIALYNGRSVCVTDRGLAIYDSPFDFDMAAYPEHVTVGDGVFTFSYYNHIILYTNGNFVFYSPDRRIWSGIRVVNRARDRERKDQHKWDENGAYIRLAEGYQSDISGVATLKLEPRAIYAEEDGLEFNPGTPFGNAGVAVRTEDPDGRFLDVKIDNTATTLPPQKGFYYKGLEDDLLSRASYGVQGAGLAASRVMPGTLTEGGAAVFSSKAKTGNRDRSFVTATAGGGHLLSSTEWRSFGYEPLGVYHLHEGENWGIVASSVRMYVDGIPLPETDFIYDPGSRSVRLLRRDKSNPTSLIQISFSSKVFPDDRTVLEPFPENHFGRYGFVEGAVSPRSWLSARGGVFVRENGDELTPVILAGIPVELRGGANRALLLYPEVAYNNIMGTHSASVAMGAREDRAFGSYRGLWVGKDFNGIDRQTFGYRELRDEHEVGLGYDLFDNFRAGWYQQHRRVDGSDLSHFELRSSYTGRDLLPDVEMSVSSRIMDYGHGPSLSSRSRKETLMLRVSDLSSRLLGEMNRIHSVGYDFSWTEYRDDSGRQGRVVYGASNVSPTSSLTFAGTGMYRLNPSGYRARSEVNPSIAVYARDLPRGFDASTAYSVYVTNLSAGGSGVGMGRNLHGYFYPGEYMDALSRFAVYLGYGNSMESHAYPTESSFRYAFFSGENTFMVNTTEEAGIICFPTDNLLLSSLSARHRDFVTSAAYHNRERAKLWLSNGSSLEGSLDIINNSARLYLGTSAMYEHKWENELLTGVGAFVRRNSQDSNVDLFGGPQFSISQTKGLNGFVKNIEHSHIFWAAFHPDEMLNPDFEYKLYLRLKMPPNMSLAAEMNMLVNRLRSGSGGGGIYLHAGF